MINKSKELTASSKVCVEGMCLRWKGLSRVTVKHFVTTIDVKRFSRNTFDLLID